MGHRVTLGDYDQVVTEGDVHAMTHEDDARVADLVARLGDADATDLFRRLVERGMQDLIDVELSAAIGAEPHERTESRSNHRNGARSRTLSTPAGDVELRIPKLRVGSFYPSLLEPRRRVDQALWAVIMTAYITGTSTRKVDDLVRALGCDSGVSRSTVSRITKRLEEKVTELRSTKIDEPITYLYLDATFLDARWARSVESVSALVAYGIAPDGKRRLLSVTIGAV